MTLDSTLKHRHTVVAAVSDHGGMNENANTMDTNWAAADASLAVWLEMWNTDGEIARRICSEDFRIHFLTSEPDGSNPGDDVLGAASFARFVDWFRDQHGGPVFTEVARVIDGAHGRMMWNAQVEELAVGGIDIFDFTEDGLIREVWSATGTRTHLT